MVTHETCFADWAKEHFQPALNSAHRAAEAFLNRPGIQELRKLDEQLSCTATLQMHAVRRSFRCGFGPEAVLCGTFHAEFQARYALATCSS